MPPSKKLAWNVVENLIRDAAGDIARDAAKGQARAEAWNKTLSEVRRLARRAIETADGPCLLDMKKTMERDLALDPDSWGPFDFSFDGAVSPEEGKAAMREVLRGMLDQAKARLSAIAPEAAPDAGQAAPGPKPAAPPPEPLAADMRGPLFATQKELYAIVKSKGLWAASDTGFYRWLKASALKGRDKKLAGRRRGTYFDVQAVVRRLSKNAKSPVK